MNTVALPRANNNGKHNSAFPFLMDQPPTYLCSPTYLPTRGTYANAPWQDFSMYLCKLPLRKTNVQGVSYIPYVGAGCR